MAIESISVFKTPDGTLHLTKVAAERHQAGLDLDAFFQGTCFNGMRADDVSAIVKEHAIEIAFLLEKLNAK